MKSLLILLSLVAFARAQTEPTCPLFYSPWKIDANGTQFTCLRIMSTDDTWNTHRVECAEPGAGYRLAIISSVETQVELANYLPTVDDYSTESFFIGATDLALEGTYYWDNRIPVRNALWAPGEPDGGIQENCACLCPSTFLMCDCPCDYPRYAICEYII